MTNKTCDIRLKRLEARVKSQDEYLNRVLQLLVKLLARLTALESATVWALNNVVSLNITMANA